MAEVKILVADDDRALAESVQKRLESVGYTVRTVLDGHSALRTVEKMQPDLVILDISFTGGPGNSSSPDGLEVLKAIRAKSNVPVLMLSAISVNSVKVFALTSGADDYLTKPFDHGELLARVQAVLRRSHVHAANEQTLRFKNLRLDPGSRRVWRDDNPVELTALEFDLLHALASRPGRVLSRDQLVDQVWSYNFVGDPRVVDVHIMNLRRKIEPDPANPGLITTVRGRGYRFEDSVT